MKENKENTLKVIGQNIEQIHLLSSNQHVKDDEAKRNINRGTTKRV